MLETGVLAYGIMAPFIVPYLVDEYALGVDYCCGDHSATGVNKFNL